MLFGEHFFGSGKVTVQCTQWQTGSDRWSCWTSSWRHNWTIPITLPRWGLARQQQQTWAEQTAHGNEGHWPAQDSFRVWDWQVWGFPLIEGKPCWTGSKPWEAAARGCTTYCRMHCRWERGWCSSPHIALVPPAWPKPCRMGHFFPGPPEGVTASWVTTTHIGSL